MSHSVPKDLLEIALRSAMNAYAPYSGFSVGAAVRTKDGSVYVGANMENASYGMTMCAEVGALQSASAHAKLEHVVEIAVLGGPSKNLGKTAGRIVTPCGRCRQLILEAAHLGDRDIDVWCADAALTKIEHFKISELLPHGFGPANLRVD